MKVGDYVYVNSKKKIGKIESLFYKNGFIPESSTEYPTRAFVHFEDECSMERFTVNNLDLLSLGDLVGLACKQKKEEYLGKFGKDHIYQRAREACSYLMYTIIGRIYDSCGDPQEYELEKMLAAKCLIEAAGAIITADSSCDWSSAQASYQEAAKIYPSLNEDPGYDENGSL